MGNFSKKLLGMGVLGAAAGAAYYFMKQKEENPDLQEGFAEFQDNVKETAASAVHVASKLKEAVEKSVDEAVSRVKEHADDFMDDDIFEDDSFDGDMFEEDGCTDDAFEEDGCVKDSSGEDVFAEETDGADTPEQTDSAETETEN